MGKDFAHAAMRQRSWWSKKFMLRNVESRLGTDEGVPVGALISGSTSTREESADQFAWSASVI
jgi:hypothetical protein